MYHNSNVFLLGNVKLILFIFLCFFFKTHKFFYVTISFHVKD